MAASRKTFDFSHRNERFTHNCFRYPAKFHPPIAAQLIKDFAAEGSVILDPFCGSGTVNLEADIAGLKSFGLDCDPLAIFVANAKTETQDVGELKRWVSMFLARSQSLSSGRAVHVHDQPSAATLRRRAARLQRALPPIPNIQHWYHPAVAIELGLLRDEIAKSRAPKQVKSVLWLTFTSVVRSASFADPVPVSGLEVTQHMRKKIEIGYEIDVANIFARKLQKNIIAFEDLSGNGHKKQSTFKLQDSTRGRLLGRKIDLLITSPPYQNAVDYYRRHSLEMYWLGLVNDHVHRRELIDNYLGRHRVAKKSYLLKEPAPKSAILNVWMQEVAAVDERRALDMRHYFTAMRRVFERASNVLTDKGRAVFVIGDSQWNGRQIPTHKILVDVAKPHLTLEAMSSYKLKNRHMSYTRHNGADIDEEIVLVFAKGGGR